MISEVLNSYKSTTLSQMNDVALMKRVDTKFVLNISALESVLKDVQSNYSVLEIGGKNIMTYNSIYFDTPSLSCYFNHHNKRCKRLKIRKRAYVDSGIQFLEIKQKDIKGNTVKSRIKIPEFTNDLSPSSIDYVSQITHLNEEWVRSLSNEFQRITLVNFDLKERVTIDINLKYDDQRFAEQLVIVEIKQSTFDRNSPMVISLKNRLIHPGSLSKYCIGMAILQPDLKQNNFKRNILRINKIAR